MIYLDYNAGAPVYPQVQRAMEPFWSREFGNASSIHSLGQDAMQAVIRSREQVANLVGAKREDVIFTGSGTESVVTAILGGARANRERGNHVLLSAVEHTAAVEAGVLCREMGITVNEIPCDTDGVIAPQHLRECLRPDTILVSILHANNETGVIQPIEELSSVCVEHGVGFHVDAAQTVGKQAVDMHALGCDYLSLSAHKMGGPKGVGALVRRGNAPLKAHLPGHQEQGLRGGTLNVPGIVGLGEAAEINLRRKDLSPLREAFETLLKKHLPEVRITAEAGPRLGNTTHLTFPGFPGKDLIPALDMAGFCVSAGSACTSGSAQVSHVLLAMGYSQEEAATAVRISIGPETTSQELQALTKTLAKLVGVRAS